MSDLYRQASLWACDVFEDYISGGELTLPDITFAVAVAFNARGLRMLKGPGLSCLVDEVAAREITSWAWGSPEAYEFCCWICSDHIEHEMLLAPSLKEFVIDVLRGTPAPKRSQ